MGQYRLFVMDHFSGHIEHMQEFEADNDASAISAAQGWHGSAPMELWSRHHKLKRWTVDSRTDREIHA